MRQSPDNDVLARLPAQIAGEYLIWHLAPASKVFIDGRYDTVYPQKVIDQYVDFINGRPDAASVLQAYPLAAALTVSLPIEVRIIY